MRLATLNTPRGPRPAVVGRPLRRPRMPPTRVCRPAFAGLLADPARLAAAREAANRPGAVSRPGGQAKLHAPVPDPQKIICIGLNYRDHAAESRWPIPKEPVLFSKYATALIGHGGAIVLPPVSQEGRLRGRAGHRHRQEAAGTSRRSRRWTTSPATPSATTSRPATGSSRRTASSGWSARRSTRSPRSARTW